VREAELHEPAHRLEPITRRVRFHRREHVHDKFARQQPHRLVAVLLAKSFENSAALRWRAARERAEFERAVVGRDGGAQRTGTAPLCCTNLDRRRGIERSLIRGHELGRTRHAGKRRKFETFAPEIVTRTTVVVDKSMHVFQPKAAHRVVA
jgi:hypothetical protein